MFYLEKKQLINIAQLEQDPKMLNQLIADIINLDFNKLNQSRQQRLESEGSQQRSGSNNSHQHKISQSRGSVSSNKTSRRQGTPVGHPAQGNCYPTDSTLSSSISNFSNFNKRRGSVMNASDEKSPAIAKPRVNSQGSSKEQQLQAPVATINLNINGKVNNISISPIGLIGSNNQISAPKVQSTLAGNQKPILLNDPNQPGFNPQNVGARRGSDGQIVKRSKQAPLETQAQQRAQNQPNSSQLTQNPQPYFG